jgi:hypothetical protein
MSRAALLVLLLLVPAAAWGARLVVNLPKDAALTVVDRDHPDRLSCPGNCVYDISGSSVGIFSLFVDVQYDPRTNNAPWDILAMNGCRGTSALPATNGLCYLPTTGDATISFEVRYRPVVGVTFSGTVGLPLGGLYVNAGPGAPQAAIEGFACDAINPTVAQCNRHEPFGIPIAMRAQSSERATLLAVSPPCGSGDCDFAIPGDTCLVYLYQNGNPGLFPTEKNLDGPGCVSGPGITGGGGGGGGGGGNDGLKKLKDAALERMRSLLAKAIGPCGSVGLGFTLFGVPGPILGPVLGTGMLAASSPLCVLYVHRLAQEQMIYNDPPDFDVDTIAPIVPSARPTIDLPSCSGLTGDDRRTCRKLGKTLRKHLAKVQRADDVTVALRITVERASAALQQGNDDALARQLKAGGKREKQLAAAIAAEANAGAKVAAVLSGAGTTGAVSETQFTAAADVVVAKLVEQGLAESDARAALGLALTPTTLDLLAVLGQP